MEKEIIFTIGDIDKAIELCRYDGSQESKDHCVNAMCINLGISLDPDLQYPGEIIMVALWARILGLERDLYRVPYVFGDGG